MDTTMKLRALSESAKNEKNDVSHGNLTHEQNKLLELAKRNAQLEDENKKALDYLKTIAQLKEGLAQEQARTAELEAKMKNLVALGEQDLARYKVLIEEERKKTLEQSKAVEQLREILQQEQARTAELGKKTTALEAMDKELAELAAKVRDLPLLEARAREVPALEARIKELSGLEAKVQEMAALETRVQELTEALGQIYAIAATGKA